MGSVLCEHCAGACCRYLALPLDVPEDRRDFDDIRWYLMHEGISVFVEEGDWYVQIQTRCKNLRDDNLCGVYESRPSICRDYKAEDCDYSGGQFGYDHLFTHPVQLEAYYLETFGRKLPVPHRDAAAPRTPKGKKNHAIVPLRV